MFAAGTKQNITIEACEHPCPLPLQLMGGENAAQTCVFNDPTPQLQV